MVKLIGWRDHNPTEHMTSELRLLHLPRASSSNPSIPSSYAGRALLREKKNWKPFVPLFTLPTSDMASQGSYELAPIDGSEDEDRPFLNEKRPRRSSSPVDMFNKVMAFVNVILALSLATSLAVLTYSWTASTGNCKETANALEPYCSSCPQNSGCSFKSLLVVKQPRHSRQSIRLSRSSSRTFYSRASPRTPSKRRGRRYWARTGGPSSRSRQRCPPSWTTSRSRVYGSPGNTYTGFRCTINSIASIRSVGPSIGTNFSLTCLMIGSISTKVGRTTENRASKTCALTCCLH